MTAAVRATPSGVVVEVGDEVVRIDAWGRDTFRVQSTVTGTFAPIDVALVRAEPTEPASVAVTPDGAGEIVNGTLTAVVERSGRLAFRRTGREEDLVAEPRWVHELEPPFEPHRRFVDRPGGGFAVQATFAAHAGERLYGLGQHTLGRLDLKGCVIELAQRNSEVAVPVLVSSRGYGLLWNLPAVGRVELAENRTRWTADRAAQLDYLVYAGDRPVDVLERYADLTGRPPRMPVWATGFWQSNSYYRSQDEVLAVAREYHRRGLPVSALFVDYMHWNHLGDVDWDATHWPDPAAMVAELAAQGTRLMVSVWPHVSPRSSAAESVVDAGLVVRHEDGTPATFAFADRDAPEGLDLMLLDVTRPDARSHLWELVREHHHAIGVGAFWLDACEPELTPLGREPRECDVRYALGHGEAVSSLYPFFDALAIRDGLDAVGDGEAVLLARSAWAGSQRLGVAVWSGDVPSTWEALREQVGAGLNMMASGIAWWTSDLGGFFLADRDAPDFRELLVRWSQFGVCWPLFRLHGNRHPDFYGAGIFSSGGPNEIWSFGADVERSLTGLLAFRERLRPYLDAQLALASERGTPPVRPLWFEFPDDAEAVVVDDAFCCGPDLLVAPVLHLGARTRRVYLPAGAAWCDVWTGDVHDGGRWIEVTAGVDQLPLFEREPGVLGIDATWFAPAPESAA